MFSYCRAVRWGGVRCTDVAFTDASLWCHHPSGSWGEAVRLFHTELQKTKNLPRGWRAESLIVVEPGLRPTCDFNQLPPSTSALSDEPIAVRLHASNIPELYVCMLFNGLLWDCNIPLGLSASPIALLLMGQEILGALGGKQAPSYSLRGLHMTGSHCYWAGGWFHLQSMIKLYIAFQIQLAGLIMLPQCLQWHLCSMHGFVISLFFAPCVHIRKKLSLCPLCISASLNFERCEEAHTGADLHVRRDT